MLRATSFRRFVNLTSTPLSAHTKKAVSPLLLALKHRSYSSNSEMSTTVAEVNPNTTKIGWIGTGVMGTSMCGHM